MQLTTETRLKGRVRSIARAARSFNPSLPREGRLARQCRRCFVANRVVSMRQLREWCYPGQARQHWHYSGIYLALRRLGAKRVGWGVYAANR
jgi:hypothetical protein